MKILIGCAGYRADVLAMFNELRGKHDLVFIEFDQIGADPALYREYGMLSRWNDFEHAWSLIEATTPQRIILMGDSLNELALRVVARAQGIPVLHLEHGLRYPLQTQAPVAEIETPKKTVFEKLGRVPTTGTDFWSFNQFFLRSMFVIPDPYCRAHLQEYFELYLEVPKTLVIRKRMAEIWRFDAHISFSPSIFQFHAATSFLPPDHPVHFIGVPQFDDFFVVERPGPGSYILLIDHPYAHAGLYGWTSQFRKRWARELLATLRKSGYSKKLLVKTHPIDRCEAWEDFRQKGEVEIVPRDSLPLSMRDISHVLTSFSTLALPFLVQPHIRSIALDIHPTKVNTFVPWEMAQIVTRVTDWERLRIELDRPNPTNADAKTAFLTNYLHTLNGRARIELERCVANPFTVETWWGGPETVDA